jgi:hypothetical protein
MVLDGTNGRLEQVAAQCAQAPPAMQGVLERMDALALATQSALQQCTPQQQHHHQFGMEHAQQKFQEACSKYRRAWQHSVLRAIIETAAIIVDFSRYGPSLYADNPPPAVRQSWHCALMDESLVAGGLQPLPTVLAQLIGEYYSLPIPFLPEEAEQQTSQFALVDGLQSASKVRLGGAPSLPWAEYEGMRVNPVEMPTKPMTGGWRLHHSSDSFDHVHELDARGRMPASSLTSSTFPSHSEPLLERRPRRRLCRSLVPVVVVARRLGPTVDSNSRSRFPRSNRQSQRRHCLPRGTLPLLLLLLLLLLQVWPHRRIPASSRCTRPPCRSFRRYRRRISRRHRPAAC